ncbi:MAG: hypothetical protein LBK28_00235 [Propionibacteriaceae bacterium]|jgi:hypothetical protein|nr:hypothetical protein [Propionibacteriaceae bacterium]
MLYWITDPELDSARQEEFSLDLGFPDQSSAEEWLGEFYQDLLAAGVSAVSLTDGDQIVFGPMALEE